MHIFLLFTYILSNHILNKSRSKIIINLVGKDYKPELSKIMKIFRIDFFFRN